MMAVLELMHLIPLMEDMDVAPLVLDEMNVVF